MPFDDYINTQLKEYLKNISKELNSDVLAIFSPILHGLETLIRDKIENISKKKKILSVIIDTEGGVAEVVERIVHIMRYHYDEVYFIVPNKAMSAGTILVMSGDKIFMDYFSCLGPIDPQLEADGKLIPALSYIKKFEELKEKADKGNLNSAEYALIQKLDLAELHKFEQAKELSTELLKTWLTKYKFKDWHESKSTGKTITSNERMIRAKEIADALNDNERWHSHGRALNMEVLKDLKLKIDDFSDNDIIRDSVRKYFKLLTDYMQRQKIIYFVQTSFEALNED